MVQATCEVEHFEIGCEENQNSSFNFNENETNEKISFDVVESDLLGVSKPTVQLYAL